MWKKNRFNKLKYVILLLHLIFFFCLPGWSQPISLTRYYSDTTSIVKRELAKIASRPFQPNPDSLLNTISLLLSYQTWSKAQPIEYFTPTDVLADIYTHKAQSEWMLGMFKYALLPYFIQMESGLLPVMESSIANLDSTQIYFGRVNKYMVGLSLEINRVDSTFAALLNHNLKATFQDLKHQHNINSLMQFSPKEQIITTYDSIQMQFSKQMINQSLSKWFATGFLENQKNNSPSD